MIVRLASRNLTRNRWRTVLTVLGVAVGVAILVWLKSYLMGFHDEMIRGATAAELGQIQIADVEWVKTPSTQYTFETSPEMLDLIQVVPGVEAASPRVVVYGLVGDEDRSMVAKIVGVRPDMERETTVVAGGVTEGRWLSEDAPEYPAPREAVLGKHVANQLKISVGSELVAFFEAADGSLGNELLTVVGMVSTGSSSVDRQTVYMNLSDLQVAAAMNKQLHQVAVKIANPNEAPEIRDRVQEALGDPQLAVRTWDEIMPEIKSMVELMKNSDIVMYIFVYILVAFGLFNAQRMSALRRRREFAMMVAIGVTPVQLFWTVLLETVLIAFIGALVGGVVGSMAALYFVFYGLDLGAFTSSGEMNLDMMGLSFSQVLHFAFEISYALTPMMVLVPFALLCGLWPALQAARIDVTRELNGRN